LIASFARVVGGIARTATARKRMSVRPYSPENKATKWSLTSAWNDDSGAVEVIYMEDATKSLNVANYVWDTTTTAWVKQTQNVLVTDSVYLAVDDLETICTAIQTAVEIIDDWDESDRAKVNLIVGQAGIAAGAGVVGVTVPRVTLASDDPAVTEIQDSLDDYWISNFEDTGAVVYVGNMDKAGNYFIQRHTIATGVIDYTTGVYAAYAAAWANRAGESYNDFATEF
jgi:hypothetical protein